MSAGAAAAPCQVCGACRESWSGWEAFLLDRKVRLVGFQPVVSDPDINLLIFEHRCGSSISVLTRRLRHLLPPPRSDAPRARLMDTAQCRGHCRVLGDLAGCDAPCSNARDRELIHLIRKIRLAGSISF